MAAHRRKPSEPAITGNYVDRTSASWMVVNPSTTTSATSRVRPDPHAIIDGRSNSLLAPKLPCAHQTVPECELPRSYLKRLHNIQRWTVFPPGADFAPAEEPAAVAGGLVAFFRGLSEAMLTI